jgi:methylamine dehydrogenase accessory protein MauD
MVLAVFIVQWAVMLVMAGAIFALARQVGVLHERIAPVGALAIGKGPQPGEAAPRLTAVALDGSPRTIGGIGASGRLRMLFFVAPSCPVCKQLIPTARRFARSEEVDLLFVGDGDAAQHRSMAEAHDIAPGWFVNSAEAGRAYHVGKLPYAVLIDPAGTIVSQGLVNTREHLESLMTVSETGHLSIQNYLRDRRSGGARTEEDANA